MLNRLDLFDNYKKRADSEDEESTESAESAETDFINYNPIKLSKELKKFNRIIKKLSDCKERFQYIVEMVDHQHTALTSAYDRVERFQKSLARISRLKELGMEEGAQGEDTVMEGAMLETNKMGNSNMEESERPWNDVHSDSESRSNKRKRV